MNPEPNMDDVARRWRDVTAAIAEAFAHRSQAAQIARWVCEAEDEFGISPDDILDDPDLLSQQLERTTAERQTELQIVRSFQDRQYAGYWLARRNPLLDNQRPLDVLATRDPYLTAQVLEAAKTDAAAMTL